MLIRFAISVDFDPNKKVNQFIGKRRKLVNTKNKAIHYKNFKSVKAAISFYKNTIHGNLTLVPILPLFSIK